VVPEGVNPFRRIMNGNRSNFLFGYEPSTGPVNVRALCVAVLPGGFRVTIIRRRPTTVFKYNSGLTTETFAGTNRFCMLTKNTLRRCCCCCRRRRCRVRYYLGANGIKSRKPGPGNVVYSPVADGGTPIFFVFGPEDTAAKPVSERRRRK